MLSPAAGRRPRHAGISLRSSPPIRWAARSPGWRRARCVASAEITPCVYDERPCLPVGLAVGAADQAPRACDSDRGLTGKSARSHVSWLRDRGFESGSLRQRVCLSGVPVRACDCRPNACSRLNQRLTHEEREEPQQSHAQDQDCRSHSGFSLRRLR